MVHRGQDGVVTLLERAGVADRIEIGGRTVLEPASPIVWFTFQDAWHDIGRFHDAAGTFTGLYANILTPVEGIDTTAWRTTDLFLDVWRDPSGTTTVLDLDELEDALRRGWIDEATARRARREAVELTSRSSRGEWPPRIVDAWPLERARRAIGP